MHLAFVAEPVVRSRNAVLDGIDTWCVTYKEMNK
jgi:hypothetical protein